MSLNVITYLLCSLLLLSSGEDHPGHDLPMKKISRFLEKEWDGKQIEISLLYMDKQGSYYSLVSEGQTMGYLYAGRVNTCRPGGCAVPGSTADPGEGFENFRYYMIMDGSFTVREVRIFEYNATHGHEVTARSWLRQFTGIIPGKDPSYGDEIEAISGATISGLSITADINRALHFLKELDGGLSSEKSSH